MTIVPLPGEQVQVQGVIQTAQSSVIHPPHVQTVQKFQDLVVEGLLYPESSDTFKLL